MTDSIRLDAIPEAIAAIAEGRPVVVVDDPDRENEGDLIFAASAATPELLAFTIRHSSGVVCVGLPGETLDRLALPLMTTHNTDAHRTAYTLTVDAATGVTTGISAADRAHTIRLLADPGAAPADFSRPGHVFPLRAREGGVLIRRGHTEASVDLARAAGLPEAGVLVELVHDDGTMMRAPALREFADEHGLLMISIADLAAWRRSHDTLVERVAVTTLPTTHGDFTAYGFRDQHTGVEHLALVAGLEGAYDASARTEKPTLTRVHSECLTGDVLGSRRCDCGEQLDESLRLIAQEGHGVLVYLRGHEGRGIGLVNKLRAYALQDQGHDTVDANLALGLPAEGRDYLAAAQILRDLGVSSVRLLTNNPQKSAALNNLGVQVVEQIALHVGADPHNLRYLATKRDRMGHLFPADAPATDTATDTVDEKEQS